MGEPQVGREYQVSHDRWGQFCMRVRAANGSYVTGTITLGVVVRGPHLEIGPGDCITVKRSRCGFWELPERG